MLELVIENVVLIYAISGEIVENESDSRARARERAKIFFGEK